MTHVHRCMRCGDEFVCRTPHACIAGRDVLPSIITMGARGIEVHDHCERSRRMRMEYKGYVGRVNDDGERWFGEVRGIRDVVTFEGATRAEAEQAFRDSVDDYLAMCAERGEQPNPPVAAPQRAEDAET